MPSKSLKVMQLFVSNTCSYIIDYCNYYLLIMSPKSRAIMNDGIIALNMISALDRAGPIHSKSHIKGQFVPTTVKLCISENPLPFPAFQLIHENT